MHVESYSLLFKTRDFKTLFMLNSTDDDIYGSAHNYYHFNIYGPHKCLILLNHTEQFLCFLVILISIFFVILIFIRN